MGLQVNNEHLLQLNLILGYNFYKQLLFYQRQVYKLCKLNVQAEFTMKTSCKEAQSRHSHTVFIQNTDFPLSEAAVRCRCRIWRQKAAQRVSST